MLSELQTRYIPQAFRLLRILKCIVREQYDCGTLEGSQVTKDDQPNAATVDETYFNVDISESKLIAMIMVTSMLTVSLYCLAMVDHHLHKQRKFHNQLLKINEKLNLETRLKDCSILIDRYFLYNALKSVDQLIFKSEQKDIERQPIQSDEMKVSVQELKQIQTSKLNLVQRVSDICTYVQSFHRLNRTDGMSCSSLDSIDMKLASMKKCYEESNESSWHMIDDTNKMANNERGDQRFDTIIRDNNDDNIENENDVGNKEERIESQTKRKGKLCLKKPYDIKKIKCGRKLATNTNVVRGKEKTYELARSSFIMKQLCDTNKKSSSVALLNQVNSKTVNIRKKNLIKLFSNQSKESLKSLATSVIISHTNTPEGSKVSMRANTKGLDLSHNGKMKIQQRGISETSLQKRERNNSNQITQKKITNEQIKRRLVRGYDKLRKASESRRDVME